MIYLILNFYDFDKGYFIKIKIMGCLNSRQKYIKKLKLISKGYLDERQVEEIVMNTYCK